MTKAAIASSRNVFDVKRCSVRRVLLPPDRKVQFICQFRPVSRFEPRSLLSCVLKEQPGESTPNRTQEMLIHKCNVSIVFKCLFSPNAPVYVVRNSLRGCCFRVHKHTFFQIALRRLARAASLGSSATPVLVCGHMAIGLRRFR